MRARVWVFLVGWLSGMGGAVVAGGPPNILLVVGDDIGVDYVGAYAEGPAYPPTPVLDSLAANGVLFRNAWSNPVCSPTRATILTGRYSFRTGIGKTIDGGGIGLADAELTVPEVLGSQPSLGYQMAAFGKWHLGALNNPSAPNQAGFPHFHGELDNLGNSEEVEAYFHTTEVVDGVALGADGYNTTRIVDNALTWIHGSSGPWFCAVFFHTPHSPLHAPPDDHHDRLLPPGRPIDNPVPYFQAAVQSMDHEIGRLLAGLGSAIDQTMVVFVGDNGTPQNTSVPPFLPSHAKTTVFEGGVNVPLIIKGPAVVAPGREVTALVNTTDLFSTLLDLATVDLATALPANLKLDAVNLMPYLQNPTQAPLRTWVFAEFFSPNGSSPTSADRVLRSNRFKLRRIGFTSSMDQLYDLQTDPFESTNLLSGGLGGLTAQQAAAYQQLSQQLVALLAS